MKYVLTFLDSLHLIYKLCVDSDVNYSRYVRSGNHALLINSDIECNTNIVEIPDNSKIYGFQLAINDYLPVFAFGLYLPSDKSIQKYTDSAQYLDELYNFYSKLGNVLFVGNLNTQYDIIPVSHIAERKYGLIKQFMRSNSLVSINKTKMCTGQNYTFAPFKMYVCLNRSAIAFYCAKFLAPTIQILHRIICRFIASLMCQLDDTKSILLTDHRC